MTYKPLNPLKQRQSATQAALRTAVGDRRNVAEGVRIALGSEPRTGDLTEGRAAS